MALFEVRTKAGEEYYVFAKNYDEAESKTIAHVLEKIATSPPIDDEGDLVKEKKDNHTVKWIQKLTDNVIK